MEIIWVKMALNMKNMLFRLIFLLGAFHAAVLSLRDIHKPVECPYLAVIITGQLARLEVSSKIYNIVLPHLKRGERT